jgi:methylenetetrahydrofolate dehydrogenase (NADP+) / methenyltetrahydrofolate cyclohydrolase
MIILDGEKLSENIIERLKEKQLKLKLAVVLVGDNPVSNSYISKKRIACEKIEVGFELFNFPSDIDEEKLKGEIKEICDNSDGVVIQLPLPKGFNTTEILNIIPKDKDVDMLSEASFERFKKGESDIYPPVVGAIRHLLEEYKINIGGKKIVLIGKGRLVGKPLAVWLLRENADFDIVDSKTEDMSSITKKADILISGAGSSGIIKEDMVKDGAILIDAGSTSEEGVIKGDIDKSAYGKASFVSSVPGGVGPMTVACLLENLIKLNNGSVHF